MFITIEGLDGAGKSTQIDLLLKRLAQENIKTQFVHFPRTGVQTVFGDLVAKFLRGEFGKINEVHPQLVALIFAQDRADFANTLRQWLADDYYVIADRYVLSNIAYQCAKLPTAAAKTELTEWILAFEFEYHAIPMPDISIYLEVPFSFTEHSLRNGRKGNDRDYLNGKTDIHEDSLSFQRNVRTEYERMLAHPQYQLQCVECATNDLMQSPDAIHTQIMRLLNV